MPRLSLNISISVIYLARASDVTTSKCVVGGHQRIKVLQDMGMTEVDCVVVELDDLFKDSTKDKIKDDDFDVEAELQKPAFSKTGDLWCLGQHRLFCGDSTKPESYELLMAGKQANLVVTNPPYNVNYEGTAGKIQNDNMDNDSGASVYDNRGIQCNRRYCYNKHSYQVACRRKNNT